MSGFEDHVGSPLIPPDEWLDQIPNGKTLTMAAIMKTPEYEAELWTRRFMMMYQVEFDNGMREKMPEREEVWAHFFAKAKAKQ